MLRVAKVRQKGAATSLYKRQRSATRCGCAGSAIEPFNRVTNSGGALERMDNTLKDRYATFAMSMENLCDQYTQLESRADKPPLAIAHGRPRRNVDASIISTSSPVECVFYTQPIPALNLRREQTHTAINSLSGKLTWRQLWCRHPTSSISKPQPHASNIFSRMGYRSPMHIVLPADAKEATGRRRKLSEPPRETTRRRVELAERVLVT